MLSHSFHECQHPDTIFCFNAGKQPFLLQLGKGNIHQSSVCLGSNPSIFERPFHYLFYSNSIIEINAFSKTESLITVWEEQVFIYFIENTLFLLSFGKQINTQILSFIKKVFLLHPCFSFWPCWLYVSCFQFNLQKSWKRGDVTLIFMMCGMNNW